MIPFLQAVGPTSEDLPMVASAGAAAAASGHSHLSDLDTLLHGLIAAAVVKLVQVALSSAIEGLRASLKAEDAKKEKQP